MSGILTIEPGSGQPVARRPKSVERKALEERFSRMAIGDILSYAEAEELTGMDRSRLVSMVYQIRESFAKHDRLLFVCRNNVGWERVPDGGVVEATTRQVRKLHRGAERGIYKATCVVNYEVLPPEQKALQQVNLAVFGVVSMNSDPRKAKEIARAAATSMAKVPVGDFIKSLMVGGVSSVSEAR